MLRNRRHIKPCVNPKPTIIPSAAPPICTQSPNVEPATSTTNNNQNSPPPPNRNDPNPAPYRIPRALRNLADYNAPGLLEDIPLLPWGRDRQ